MKRPNGITSIGVRHNIEVAHRLVKTPGKCQQIHGHSMWVELEMWGEVDEAGLVSGIEFGDLKSNFRHHLDTELDHRLLLSKDDPWIKIWNTHERTGEDFTTLPGLALCSDDPTTENLAKWVGEWAYTQYITEHTDIRCVEVVVHETAVNMAKWTVYSD